MRYFIKRLTLIDILIIIAVIAVLIAILVPPAKWASSGEIQLPVKIFVFDAINQRPIPDAQCLVFRSSPMVASPKLDEDYPITYPVDEWVEKHRGTTNAEGLSVIEYKFRTGANHEHPTTRAHLSYAWVRVEAIGFGGVVVPVRYAGQPTSKLRKEGQVFVTVGLVPIE